MPRVTESRLLPPPNDSGACTVMLIGAGRIAVCVGQRIDALVVTGEAGVRRVDHCLAEYGAIAVGPIGLDCDDLLSQRAAAPEGVVRETFIGAVGVPASVCAVSATAMGSFPATITVTVAGALTSLSASVMTYWKVTLPRRTCFGVNAIWFEPFTVAVPWTAAGAVEMDTTFGLLPGLSFASTEMVTGVPSGVLTASATATGVTFWVRVMVTVAALLIWSVLSVTL